MIPPSVFPLFREPSRKDTLFAVSKALLAVRETGANYKQIARIIGCNSDTIENAVAEKAMMNFEFLARLAFHFPAARPHIEGLWNMGASAEPTTAERWDRVHRDMDILRRERGE